MNIVEAIRQALKSLLRSPLTPKDREVLGELWTVVREGIKDGGPKAAREILDRGVKVPPGTPILPLLRYLLGTGIPNLLLNTQQAGREIVALRSRIVVRALREIALTPAGLLRLAAALGIPLVAALALVATLASSANDDEFPPGFASSPGERSPETRSTTDATRDSPDGEVSRVPGINPDFVSALKRCEEARLAMIRHREEYSRLTQRDWNACAASGVKPVDCPQSEEARAAALAARAAGDASMTCNKDAAGNYISAFGANPNTANMASPGGGK